MENKTSWRRITAAFGLLLVGAFVWAETTTAPKKKLSLKDLLKSSDNKSRRATTVAGVRGLDETGAAVDSKARDFLAVDRLEKVVISDDEIKAFVAEGKLK